MPVCGLPEQSDCDILYQFPVREQETNITEENNIHVLEKEKSKSS